MEAEQTVETFVVEDAGREFLGQWNRLVSTTNWEKGRIIANWRQALVAAGAQPQEYSDEAWSRQVGNVSGQHVGRLRRVYERFGAVRNDYAGLYWSHYQAAIDWDDAEMWLEGAVQNGWSISQMRYQRWEVLGKPADEQPAEEDVVSAELDEDSHEPSAPPATEAASKVDVVRDVDGGPDYGQGPDFGEEAPFDAASAGAMEGTPFDGGADDYAGNGEPAPAPVRPFAHLAELPDDLAQAFEGFKLGILRHKMANWSEVALDDVLASLDALKRLALAPAAE
jgi:hypothetical protein